jgi:hypothetical protein
MVTSVVQFWCLLRSPRRPAAGRDAYPAAGFGPAGSPPDPGVGTPRSTPVPHPPARSPGWRSGRREGLSPPDRNWLSCPSLPPPGGHPLDWGAPGQRSRGRALTGLGLAEALNTRPNSQTISLDAIANIRHCGHPGQDFVQMDFRGLL